MKIVIDDEKIIDLLETEWGYEGIREDVRRLLIENGTPLPKGHGRLGDLDELEQRISNFVERDASITDEYTLVRQRFIVDGIAQTPTIIEADKSESNLDGDPVDIDKAIEHYEGTLATLKGIDLEESEDKE